jgi:glucose-fructose oxidoreductase
VTAPRRLAGFCFDHMHMGDLLGKALRTDAYEIVGVYDTQPERMAEVCTDLGIAAELQYADWELLIEQTAPEVAVVCSTTAEHALWVERLAARGIHVLLEKPFAVSGDEAQKCIDAASSGHVLLAVNWPLAWYASHRTTQRLISEGAIGDVIEVHYYDGNRGPQFHVHDKKEIDGEGDVSRAWWFSRAAGGGSLLDYLGYGVTLATWFRGGELPSEVTAVSHIPEGFEVDMQSIVIARYATGLSSFHTRWGTFTDPWTHQPQPFCGFVVVGTEGTIMSRDYAEVVTMQTREHPAGIDIPVDEFSAGDDILALLDAAITAGETVEGPCGPQISFGGQLIVDAAIASTDTRTPVALKVKN